ncbi:hypothetical protein MHTCC0001_03190 [Flavobacteriaceae bacterium MHTCC 0001]
MLLVCFTSTLTQAQNVNVDVNLDVKHTVGNQSVFDRSKFIAVHADIDDREWDGDNFTSDLRDHFLNGYDVYLGRNTGGVQYHMNNVINEDPNRPGYADPADITSEGTTSKNNYAAKTNIHSYESRNARQIFAPQTHPFWPDGRELTSGWAFSQTDTQSEPFGTASGEFLGRYLRDFFGTGGTTGKQKPMIVEVMNEPLYDLIVRAETPEEPEKVFRFHSTVAKEIRKYNTESNLMIGGYCTAFPNFEVDNFKRWNDRWKLFMDLAGDDMDYWSIHLYDFPAIQGKEKYRKGANMEATLDMMEQYSYMKFGVAKPFLVSEFGAQKHDYLGAYSETGDWMHLKSVSPMMMQFMERSDLVLGLMNFMPIKAEWGTSDVNNVYGHRLLRRANEPTAYTGEWVYTHMVKTYQLWSDVKGTRVDSKSNNPDIMTDVYINGDKVYVILNNLDFTSKTVTLNMAGASNSLQSIKQKHLYRSGDVPVLDESTLSTAPASYTLQPEGTMILEYDYNNNITIDETSNEVKYYATDYLKTIEANTARTFAINGVNTATYGEAVLRVGVSRAHGQSLQPTITFNNTSLTIPSNFRGGPQTDRDGYFGVLEIPVPYNLLQTNNNISISFSEGGGHISTVTMQVFNFSKNIVRNGGANAPSVSFTSPSNNATFAEGADVSVVVDASDDGSISNVKLYLDGTLVRQENIAPYEWGLSSQNDTALENMAAGTYTLRAVAEDNDGQTAETSIQITVGSGTVAVTGVTVTPSTLSLDVGDTGNLTGAVVPSNATDKTMTFGSSDTSVATVTQSGVVTAVASGTATITLTTTDGGHTTSATVTVNGSGSPSVSFTSPSNNATFAEGADVSVVVDASDDGSISNVKLYLDGTLVRQENIAPYEWGLSSQNDTALENMAAGTYTLRAVAEDNDGQTAETSIQITVGSGTVAVTGVTVTPSTLSLDVGDTGNLTGAVVPSNATDKTMTFGSSDTSVATVTQSGVVTAVASGTATITLTTTDGGHTTSATVTVNGSGSPSVSFTSPSNNATFAEGADVSVVVDASDDGSISNVKLYLDGTLVRQENIAPYEWGLSSQNDTALENMAAGTYTLRAVAEDNDGQTAETSIQITVGSGTVAVTGVTVTPSTLSLNVGDTGNLTGAVVPSNATDQTMTFGSSDTSVATVTQSGVVTAVASGTATITLTTTDGSHQTTATVTVSGGSCDVPFTSTGTTISNETETWSTGSIDISCATSVNISLQASGVGPMENADYLNIYYSVDGGANVAILENENDYSAQTLTVNNINGNTLEIIVEGKTSTSDEIYTVNNISVSTGTTAKNALNKSEALNKIDLFPNPAKELLHISTSQEGDYSIHIYNVHGRMVFDKLIKRTGDYSAINIKNLTSGLYIIRIRNVNETKIGRFIKE